jgi:hypothetical protein
MLRDRVIDNMYIEGMLNNMYIEGIMRLKHARIMQQQSIHHIADAVNTSSCMKHRMYLQHLCQSRSNHVHSVECYW